MPAFKKGKKGVNPFAKKGAKAAPFPSNNRGAAPGMASGQMATSAKQSPMKGNLPKVPMSKKKHK